MAYIASLLSLYTWSPGFSRDGARPASSLDSGLHNSFRIAIIVDLIYHKEQGHCHTMAILILQRDFVSTGVRGSAVPARVPRFRRKLSPRDISFQGKARCSPKSQALRGRVNQTSFSPAATWNQKSVASSLPQAKRRVVCYRSHDSCLPLLRPSASYVTSIAILLYL